MQAMVRKTTSSDTPIGARATLQAGIEHLYADIPNGTGWANCAFNNLTLSSHFQPIFSVVQQRCVAYEGLLRANNALGTAMGPETVFALSADKQEELFLDWLCRALHLRNFGNLAVDDALIFINAFPAAAIEDPRHPGVFAKMIGHFGANPNNVVIEILETGVSDEAQLVDAAALYRQLGCKIAIDDFGVGYSNFDRLWRLRPDFVKIDRSVIVSATREAHARLVLANMVKLIQHCGAQVVVEGIETRDQALTALAAGADFLQGYYLARPGTSAMPVALCDSLFRELTGELTNKFSGDFNAPNAPNFARGMTRNQFDLTSYASMLNDAVRKLQRGVTLADATLGFLAMPQVMRTYLVTAHPVDGARPGIELKGGSPLARLELDLIDKANQSADPSDPNGWALEQLQQVMQQAIAAPQQMHYSANDDVVATVSPRSPSAITLSCAFELGERTVVLCGDLLDRRDWKSIRAGGGVGAGRADANTFTDKFGDDRNLDIARSAGRDVFQTQRSARGQFGLSPRELETQRTRIHTVDGARTL